ncbi:suppressor of ferric uptake 1-like [Lolium rigidum]|uniref:suppressor of ferric uptake 1-like n=1 Tax=Lolium rigidum TaxID=89674 RepID=UPI001F5CF951|nr:suppressor of ferric uptake 1-like [Lolium rigidum]
MVVADGLQGDAVADDIFASDGDLQAFFQQAELEVPAGGGGAGLEELEWLLNEDAFPAVETMEPKQAVTGRRTTAAEPGQRRCQHCGTTETPQWRQGPEGRGTLCNACGVRYRTGRLLPEYRPVNSPTFSPQVHSNRHHRVVEMHHRRGSSARDMNAGLEVTAGAGGEGAAAEEELDWLSNKDALPAKETTERKPPVVRPQTMAAVYRRRRALASSPSPTWPSAGGVPGQRRCRHCSTTETPQWRQGPEGRGTLCNACGVSYGKGHLVPQYRPLSSPTFSPELHSNIHRRVIQMPLPVPVNIDSITQ